MFKYMGRLLIVHMIKEKLGLDERDNTILQMLIRIYWSEILQEHWMKGCKFLITGQAVSFVDKDRPGER